MLKKKLLLRRRPAVPAQRQAGLSIIELMVGLMVGLAVVLAAATLFAGQLNASRRLVLETRVNQDLRAAADIVARDLRRSGYWQEAIKGAKYPATLNPYRAVTDAAPLTYSFSRDATENNSLDNNERFGFQLQNQAIEMQLSNGNWQQVTDPNSVLVTNFTVTPVVTEISLGNYCSPVCAAGSAGCPSLKVRRYDIVLRGRATSDATVVREIREAVRLRNDEVPVATCP